MGDATRIGREPKPGAAIALGTEEGLEASRADFRAHKCNVATGGGSLLGTLDGSLNRPASGSVAIERDHHSKSRGMEVHPAASAGVAREHVVRPSFRHGERSFGGEAENSTQSSNINQASPLPLLSVPSRSSRSELRELGMTARKISVTELKGGSELVRNAHMSVRLLPSHRLVVLARTESPFETADELDACVGELRRAVPLASRALLSMLVDMQRAPIRVHPALDPAFDRFRHETELGFSRTVVVVTTPLGRIRTTRLQKTSVAVVMMAGSLEEALGLLAHP